MPLVPKVGRKAFKIKLLIIGITIFLWLGVALHMFFFWWLFSSSLKGNVEIFQFPPTLWPKQPYWAVYSIIFKGICTLMPYPVQVYIKNSFIMVGGVMLLQIPISMFAAYSLSKLQTAKWTRFLFLFFIGTMLIPGTVNLIPRYLLMKNFPFMTKSIPCIPFTDILFPHLNFLNTYWAVILPGTVSAFSILLFKGFFDTIPDELINAARLDGASEPEIFRRIVLPISKPVVAVVSYFTFTGVWNDFVWPLIVIQKPKLYPLSLAIYKAQDLFVSSPTTGSQTAQKGFLGWNGLMAMAVIESIPVFVAFLILREGIMKGIRLRGFK